MFFEFCNILAEANKKNSINLKGRLACLRKYSHGLLAHCTNWLDVGSSGLFIILSRLASDVDGLLRFTLNKITLAHATLKTLPRSLL